MRWSLSSCIFSLPLSSTPGRWAFRAHAEIFRGSLAVMHGLCVEALKSRRGSWSRRTAGSGRCGCSSRSRPHRRNSVIASDDMATAIRTIGHEERLSIVDHLEELRTRLIVSGVAFAIVFGLCFWQNHALLSFINRPLHKQTEQQVLRGEGPAGATWLAQKGGLEVARDTQRALGVLSADRKR